MPKKSKSTKLGNLGDDFLKENPKLFKVLLKLNGKEYVGWGGSVEEALKDLKVEYGIIKTYGELFVFRGDTVSNTSITPFQARKIFNKFGLDTLNLQILAKRLTTALT